MNEKARNVINIILSFIIVFCSIMTVFLVVKKREIERREVITVLNSKAVSPIDDYVEKTDYAISLNSIINGYQFKGSYDTEIEYRGVKYNFLCTRYYNDKCMSGESSFTYNGIIYDLFSYNSDDDNYLKKPYDLIIIKNGDKYAILRSNLLSIYDASGIIIKEFDNVIIRYSDDDNNYEKRYPSYSDNTIKYYTCDREEVFYHVNYLDMSEEDSVIKEENYYCEIN